MTLIHFILVFVSVALADYLWAKYINAVSNKHPHQAALLGIVIYLFAAYNTVSYVQNAWYLVPCCLGGYAGTWFSVWQSKRKTS